jgi:hypothetical protein
LYSDTEAHATLLLLNFFARVAQVELEIDILFLLFFIQVQMFKKFFIYMRNWSPLISLDDVSRY